LPTVLYMPKLGEIMKEATVVKWLRAEGESISKGEPVVEVETEKINVEIEAPETGILLKIYSPQGKVCAIADPLGAFGKLGEVPPEFVSGEQKARATATHEINMELGSLPGREMPLASPAAKKFAAEHGIDLGGVRGSGPGGRIVLEDVSEKVLQATDPGEPLTLKRRTIADRLSRSFHDSVPVTIMMEAEMTRAVALRKVAADISFTDILVKAVCNCLLRKPIFNATFENGLVKKQRSINISLAVSSPEGLLVPVIKEAEKLPIEEISRVSRKLVSDARAGDLDVTSVEGGTFTISNLGMYGVDSFTPIINPPQIAVLGVGRIVDRPIATGGQLDVKPMISLCLTFDHRVVDGTEAAEFLKDIKHELEQEVH